MVASRSLGRLKRAHVDAAPAAAPRPERPPRTTGKRGPTQSPFEKAVSPGKPPLDLLGHRPFEPVRPMAFEFLSPAEHQRVLLDLQQAKEIAREPLAAPRALFENDNFKLTLKCRDGRVFHAVYKTGLAQHWTKNIFLIPRWEQEIVAYQLSEAMRMGLVPPTIEREFNGKVGALQFWMQGHTDLYQASFRRPPVPRSRLDKLFAFHYVFRNCDAGKQNHLVPGIGIDFEQLMDSSHRWSEKQWRQMVNGVLQVVETQPEPDPSARKWLVDLTEEPIVSVLEAHQYPAAAIGEAIQRLRHVQEHGLPF